MMKMDGVREQHSRIGKAIFEETKISELQKKFRELNFKELERVEVE